MKPYIICHMTQSVDGRVACDMVDKISGDEYYTALESLNCQAHIEGANSYRIHYCGFEEFKPQSGERMLEDSFYKATSSPNWSVSVETRGTLLWEGTDNENRICIVSREVSPEYLEYLKEKGISYIVAGESHVNLEKAMNVLRDEFGVERVAVVGGGKINGGFLAAGLLDELSTMIAPGVDGRSGQPALFDGINDHSDFLPTKLKLKDLKPLTNGVIWARYEIL